MEEDIILKIKDTIEKLQPFVINDGGLIEYVKYEDNILYIKLSGACQGCPFVDMTLTGVIEKIIMDEIPEVKAVKNVDEAN